MLNYITKKLENGVKCYIVPKKGYAEKKAMIAFKLWVLQYRVYLQWQNYKTDKGNSSFFGA